MEIATSPLCFIPMRCPPNCPLNHKHEYQPLPGPSRHPRNGRHQTVVPYPHTSKNHIGLFGTIPRNPPIGTHQQTNANSNQSGGIWGPPSGFRPRVEPAPTPIRAFTPDWREPRQRLPRGNPRVYEVPIGMLIAHSIAYLPIH